MTPAETILALAGGVGGIGTAASKVWDWYRSRDAAKLAAVADEAKHRREALSTERVDMIGLLREQIKAGDDRGEKSAARADAMVDALRELAEQVRALGGAVADVRDAIGDHTHREASTLASIDARLSLLTSGTGEQPRASIVPGALRAPTPPLPAVPAPPRRVP